VRPERVGRDTRDKANSQDPLRMSHNTTAPIPTTMPPRPRSLNAFAPRSRKGCLVCRSRRVKCDEGESRSDGADGSQARLRALPEVQCRGEVSEG
jgi:hypothetical protein